MKDLTEGNIFKNFIKFAIPLILSGLLSQAFNTVDTIIVGKCLGEHGLAAVGSTGTFIEVISSIIWGIGTGSAIYIATLFGSGNYKKMVNAVKINMLAVIFISVLISVLVIGFHNQIFSLLRIEKSIYKDSFIYFAIYMGGFFALTINWCSVYIFNAFGMTSFPLKVSILSCIGNLAGNVLFIQVFKWGVAGAAIATVLVAVICSICYFYKFSVEFKNIGVSKQKIEFDKMIIVNSWKLGIPCMLQQVIMYLSSVSIQPLINGIGTAAIASYAVCMRIYSINSTIFQNSSKCLMNYCAQCIGGKKVELIKKGIKVAVLQGLFLAIPVMLLCIVFKNQIVLLFFDDINGKASQYTILYIMLCVPFVVFQIINNLFHNFYKGTMATKIAFYTTAVYSVVRLILTYVLAPKDGMNGVFIALIISWVAETVLAIIIYYSGKWKKYIKNY